MPSSWRRCRRMIRHAGRRRTMPCSHRTPRRRARNSCATRPPAKSRHGRSTIATALAPGVQHRRPGDHRRGRNLDARRPGLERDGERPRLHRTDAGDASADVARNQRAGADPSPDHVEPPDRRGRGAGADHDPHRLLHHGARGRRSVRRHLRSARPHDGAGGHRHARPRQFDGGKRRPFPAEVPGRDDAARRSLHHQRSVARHRPSARPDRRHARPSTTSASSACSPTPRTSSMSAASAWDRKAARCSRKGMYIPIVKCFDQGRPNETFFDFMRAGSRLPVELEGDIYSLCACNDAGAHRLVEMMDEFEMDSLDPLADFIFDSSHRATLAEIARIPQRHLPRRNLLRRLRGAGHAEGRDDHPAMTASRWTSPAPRAFRRAASTCRPPIAAPIPASASSASSRRRFPTTGRASRRSA